MEKNLTNIFAVFIILINVFDGSSISAAAASASTRPYAALATVGPSVIVKCVLNPYYIPVCGSDSKTYGNKDLLNCHNRHKPRQRQIRAVSHRECGPLICPSYRELIGPWPTAAASHPVCANNGYTYGHIHQVRCLKDFIPSLEIIHEGGCSLYEVRRTLGRNAHRKACAEPRVHFETNVICGRNNETFVNPFRALCTRPRAIKEKVGGPCGCPLQRSCEKAHEIQQMLKVATNGSSSDRTKYIVCGTDRRTYRSQYHLECTRRFNKYLKMVHHGRCKKVEDPCPEKLKYITTAQPVCGSDKKSYVNYEALLCAKYRISRGLKYLHDGPCVRKT